MNAASSAHRTRARRRTRRNLAARLARRKAGGKLDGRRKRGQRVRLVPPPEGGISMRIPFAILAVVAGLLAHNALAQDLNTDQLIKYYRKKNNVPPAQTVSVSGIKDSSIKGAKEGVLDV